MHSHLVLIKVRNADSSSPPDIWFGLIWFLTRINFATRLQFFKKFSSFMFSISLKLNSNLFTMFGKYFVTQNLMRLNLLLYNYVVVSRPGRWRVGSVFPVMVQDSWTCSSPVVNNFEICELDFKNCKRNWGQVLSR